MNTTTRIHSLGELSDLAALVAGHLQPGSILRLDGTLGAGKTHFVKALAAALGYPGEVSSPTFPLVHEYRWDDHFLAHLDFYRLQRVDEIHAAGLEEYLPGEGISVVEWAVLFPEVFPSDSWQIELSIIDETTREVRVASPGY